MIKRASDMKSEIREQMRGGEGTIGITHVFSADELRGKCRLCAHITVSPGSSIGLHEHVDEEEIFYVLKGKGVVRDGGSEVSVSAGDAILTGGGESHSVQNTGEEPLEMVAVILLYQ